MSVATTRLDGFFKHGVRVRWMSRGHLPFTEQWMDSQALFPTEQEANDFVAKMDEANVAHVTMQGRML